MDSLDILLTVVLVIGLFSYIDTDEHVGDSGFCQMEKETGSFKPIDRLDNGESLEELERRLGLLRNTFSEKRSAFTEDDIDWMFERMRMMLSLLQRASTVDPTKPVKSKYSEPSNHQSDNNEIKDPESKPSDDLTSEHETTSKDSSSVENSHESMHLAVVACGDRLEETLVMIKSSLIFSRAMLHIHIFADDDLQPLFRDRLDTFPSDIRQRFSYHIHDISFPEGQKPDEWRGVFKTCATQRLFLPDLLPGVRRLMYVDTDILFMSPLEDVWDFFYKFNATQLAALSWEHENGNAGWYNRFARHPYYPPFGVNSGVMLMDLEMLRKAGWVKLMVDYYKEYKFKITWGDQDLINIFFHHYPEKLYVFRCQYNYRPDHCMYMQNCRPAAENGVYVVHGNRGVYHNEKQVTFKAIYETFQDYEFGKPLSTHLLEKMRLALDETVGSKDRCASSRHLFTKALENSVKLDSLKDKPNE